MNTRIKILTILTFSIGLFSPSFASMEDNYYTAANFIAQKWVIVEQSSNSNYNVENTITRREMLKVMMNISGKTVSDTCTGKFSDMNSADWGCKYAEAALSEWYIAANATFRPSDSVTKIEALKMIMQAANIERDDNDDWRIGYVSKAIGSNILDSSFSDYNTASLRGWIFLTGSKTYSDTPEFQITDDYYEGLTPEEEELLNDLLNI